MASHKRNSSAEPNAAAAGAAKDSITPDTNPEGVGGPEIVSGEGFVGDAMQKLQAERQEMMDTLVRRQADFENFKKRAQREGNKQQLQAAIVRDVGQALLNGSADYLVQQAGFSR